MTDRECLSLAILTVALAGMGTALGEDGKIAPTSAGERPSVSAPVTEKVSLVVTGNPLWAISLERLSATRDRPIFLSSRRPQRPPSVGPVPAPAVARVEPPAPAPPERPKLQLLGAISGPGEGYAVFIEETTRKTVRLKTGDGYGGWLLRSVNGSEVILEKSSHKLTLALPSPTREVQK